MHACDCNIVLCECIFVKERKKKSKMQIPLEGPYSNIALRTMYVRVDYDKCHRHKYCTIRT